MWCQCPVHCASPSIPRVLHLHLLALGACASRPVRGPGRGGPTTPLNCPLGRWDQEHSSPSGIVSWPWVFWTRPGVFAKARHPGREQKPTWVVVVLLSMDQRLGQGCTKLNRCRDAAVPQLTDICLWWQTGGYGWS
jgi:hypothetical protein